MSPDGFASIPHLGPVGPRAYPFSEPPSRAPAESGKDLVGLHKIEAARNALERLLKRGADPHKMTEYLSIVYRNRAARPANGERLKHRRTVHDSSLNQIRKLPALCRHLSQQIAAADLRLSSGVLVRAKHHALHEALRHYAFEVSKTLKGRAAKNKRVEPDTHWKLSLIGYVRTSTKKPHYEETSQLIREYFSLNGNISNCSASSLKTLWSDHMVLRHGSLI
jgi:hypothetical protein